MMKKLANIDFYAIIMPSGCGTESETKNRSQLERLGLVSYAVRLVSASIVHALLCRIYFMRKDPQTKFRKKFYTMRVI